ncbi:MAG: GtrA family protein [Alistipes sp.]|nr:GtrA family protein [Alistipes sp.]MBQ4127425.1 GtrA family protein [Alistipes sp.]
MSLAQFITRVIDALYVKPVAAIVPQQLWRYGVCGVTNMALDALWYFVIYHFVICKRFIDVGFVVVSPHIASLVLVFPITFFTGFWLNRNVAFRSTSIGHGRQLWRYALSVAGAIAINYFSMKLLVEACDVWPTPAKMLTTVLSSIYSFLAAKFFTFREEKA